MIQIIALFILMLLPAFTHAEPAILETGTGKLYGTAGIPKAKPPYPVALIISGSGPTDRDGNSAALPGQNNSLKMLAEGLAGNGIASLRYDKRGVAASTDAGRNEHDLRFETYVADAVGWCSHLRKDSRFSSLIIIGHSEGSLIGMLAARKAEADAFISVSGPARPAHEIIRDQLNGKLPPHLMQSAEEIIGQLSAGKTSDAVPYELNALFRKSVQPYLISWFRYNPSEEIARLSVPALIIQGTTDIQVPVSEAKALAQSCPKARLALIQGMNHILKEIPEDTAKQFSSYADPTIPVCARLILTISDFVAGVNKQER